jgi:hypothetical protein
MIVQFIGGPLAGREEVGPAGTPAGGWRGVERDCRVE